MANVTLYVWKHTFLSFKHYLFANHKIIARRCSCTQLFCLSLPQKTNTKQCQKGRKKFSRSFENTTYHSLVTSILRARLSKRRNVGGVKTVLFTARTSSCETIKATSTISSASIVTMTWTFTTSRLDSKQHFKRKGNPRVESSRSLLQNA